eukprot:Protomagalhaensia_sp_Gyna_25__327@NODE_1153_length_2130_cov_19_627929_g850_i1_p1_GENE_NODE_1153_length_2130_cov_19_627929_g850_i1NODE_1153_length_2130_cov_19_627929_g850_i1_p1_ORF_typecomplete_len339_score54_46zfC3HC4_2/PF13923_6/1_1e10zfRING_2/PF13639_6/4_7e10zfC3HC4/PF00097_25/7_1e09zfC3HC4_3/PF13920_6/2_9e08zfANAPC11/PF12861_7/7e08zfrbx1/PF12678_7/9e08ProkRING_4/PF14447_6/4_5e07zfRING_5/PF14634_6/9_8e06zfRING_UBOX/PF13445_6/0_00011zfRING_UBOX/PF13445_6/1_2e03FANCL_C/PF11793_8/8_7e05Ubox/PF045
MLPEQRILYDVLVVIAQRQAIAAARQDAGAELGALTKALSNLRLAANSVDLLDVALRKELRLLAEKYASQLTPQKVDVAVLTRVQALGKKPEIEECSICLASNVEVTTECGHRFHRDCLFDWLANKHDDCPMCRRPVTVDGLRAAPHLQILDNALTSTTLLRFDGDIIQEVSSNKVTVALKEIARLHELFVVHRSQNPHASAPKIVAFCNIKPMLVALSQLVAAIGLGHFWLVAGAEESATQKELSLFKRATKTSVLLAMPRASSTKFDLSFASMVLILDPWRRSKRDEVSLGMVRKGTQTSVRVLKLASERSVEEEILKGPITEPTLEATASRIILA